MSSEPLDVSAISAPRKMSHGIGGAGNIKSISDFAALHNSPSDVEGRPPNGGRRRSSVLSKFMSSDSQKEPSPPGSPPAEKKGIFGGVFSFGKKEEVATKPAA